MEDCQIVDQYWARDEKAIENTDKKYGRLLRSLSFSVLSSHEDAEECTNDTYLEAWNAMPDARPTFLGAFLSKIVRRVSIDRYRHDHRQKRGGFGPDAAVEELTECIPDDAETPDGLMENQRLRDTINLFLSGLPEDRRVLFVNRYFYNAPIAELAGRSGYTETNVKVILHRLREQLRSLLEKEELL
ncbi:MAG: sigma-70 family RNA polymerase sigma factor [Clostridia bacterium]|nr:sigma-70 family RNA polymerase sigma factor [Clostridia bacterium]